MVVDSVRFAECVDLADKYDMTSGQLSRYLKKKYGLRVSRQAMWARLNRHEVRRSTECCQTV